MFIWSLFLLCLQTHLSNPSPWLPSQRNGPLAPCTASAYCGGCGSACCPTPHWRSACSLPCQDPSCPCGGAHRSTTMNSCWALHGTASAVPNTPSSKTRTSPSSRPGSTTSTSRPPLPPVLQPPPPLPPASRFWSKRKGPRRKSHVCWAPTPCASLTPQPRP